MGGGGFQKSGSFNTPHVMLRQFLKTMFTVTEGYYNIIWLMYLSGHIFTRDNGSELSWELLMQLTVALAWLQIQCMILCWFDHELTFGRGPSCLNIHHIQILIYSIIS